jgi:endonuclease G, mitochondrial
MRTVAGLTGLDYLGRRGFDSHFLGRPMLLPKLTRTLAAGAARMIDEPKQIELKYQHFSIVMNAARRLPFYTAVNIDGMTTRKVTREQDVWQYDPRVPREMQIGAELYDGDALDFGHLVRRLDPVWGATMDEAKLANDDTFHLTNCAPQHAGFNRNKTTWAGVEDYILKNAIAEKLRVSVFTGPVLAVDDPVFRGVQLPLRFWKVVGMVKDGALSVTAYMLDQSDLIHSLVSQKGERDFAFGAYRTFQVQVSEMAAMTGLRFGVLPRSDPLAKGATGRRSVGDKAWREVRRLDAIVL